MSYRVYRDNSRGRRVFVLTDAAGAMKEVRKAIKARRPCRVYAGEEMVAEVYRLSRTEAALTSAPRLLWRHFWSKEMECAEGRS